MTIRPIPGTTTRASLVAGRINRKTYWLMAAAVLLIGVGLSFVPLISRFVAYGTTVVWVMLYGRRLHDFGRSAWWLMAIIVPTLLVALVMAIAGVETDVAMGVAVLIQLTGTAVLGAIPGTPGDNRFGPPPGAPPVQATSDVFR